MKYKQPRATLLQASPLFVSEVAARVCYNSFDRSECPAIRSFGDDGTGLDMLRLQDIDSSDVLDKLTWAYQHESILEHTTLSFFVEDLSREILQELARHRIGMAISVKSTRYTIEDLVNAYCNLRDANDNTIDNIAKLFVDIVKDNIIVSDDDWISVEANTLYLKLELYNREELLVKGLTGSKKKKQNDRVKRCLPETWTTKTVLTFNLRALKHFVELRDSGSAYYGIRELTQEIINKAPEKYMRFIKKPKDLKVVEGH
jgi:thymidylate synthase (FAD)